MSRLTDLLRQARKVDPQLGADLEAEIGALKQRSFGLVYEQHRPGAVELPGRFAVATRFGYCQPAVTRSRTINVSGESTEWQGQTASALPIW